MPGRNLDPWLVGDELVAPLFRHGADGADVAVIEGVMGLFDGAAGRGDLASTAHVARLLDAPVVLVVDAAGTSRSVAATVHGFASWDRRVRLAGVVLNRVASERHETLLRDALAPTGVPVLGALPREATLHTPSRHLGLVPASERPGPVADWLPGLRALVARGVDLDGLMAVARAAPGLAAERWSPATEPPTAARAPPARVAVAAGRAFTFGYAEHDELLAAAGAEVVTFDPLTAERLPEGTDALVVGGGFPQVYIDQLAGNTTLRHEVRERAGAGMPVVAECAGLLWLGASLDGRDQCGVLPARGPHDRNPPPRLPGGDRAARHAAGLGGHAGTGPRVPPDGQRPGARRPPGVGARRRHPAGLGRSQPARLLPPPALGGRPRRRDPAGQLRGGRPDGKGLRV